MNWSNDTLFPFRPFGAATERTIAASNLLFFCSKKSVYIAVLLIATSKEISLLCKKDLIDALEADTPADDENRFVKCTVKLDTFSRT